MSTLTRNEIMAMILDLRKELESASFYRGSSAFRDLVKASKEFDNLSVEDQQKEGVRYFVSRELSRLEASIKTGKGKQKGAAVNRVTQAFLDNPELLKDSNDSLAAEFSTNATTIHTAKKRVVETAHECEIVEAHKEKIAATFGLSLEHQIEKHSD